MSIDIGMNNEDVVHIHKGILKRMEQFTFSNMDGPRDYQAVKQSQREPRYCITYAESKEMTEMTLYHLQYEMIYLQNRNRLTNLEKEFMVTWRKRGLDWDFGIDMYILLYLK